jgi:hypothetical protein
LELPDTLISSDVPAWLVLKVLALAQILMADVVHNLQAGPKPFLTMFGSALAQAVAYIHNMQKIFILVYHQWKYFLKVDTLTSAC